MSENGENAKTHSFPYCISTSLCRNILGVSGEFLAKIEIFWDFVEFFGNKVVRFSFITRFKSLLWRLTAHSMSVMVVQTVVM